MDSVARRLATTCAATTGSILPRPALRPPPVGYVPLRCTLPSDVFMVEMSVQFHQRLDHNYQRATGLQTSTSTLSRQNQPVSSTPGRQNQPVSSTLIRQNQPVSSTPGRQNQPVSSTPGRQNQPVSSTQGWQNQPVSSTLNRQNQSFSSIGQQCSVSSSGL